MVDSVWKDMYVKDKYARDRVMKSARMLLPYLKDNDVILDVGCFTQEAKKYFPPWVKYIGIDQKAYHPNSQVVDLHYGFQAIPCSHALCLETLEHLLNPKGCLDALHQSLADQGYVVLSLPNESTIFHRLRCLLGIVDGDCFAGTGKHLHLPSLKQSRQFVKQNFQIVEERYYISPSACNSKQEWLGRILSLVPDAIHLKLACMWPALFARGFIFLLKKKQL